MADQKSIAPQANVLALAASTTSREAVLKRIDEIKQNVSLTFSQKRKLITAELTAMIRARQNEVENRLDIQEMKLAADADMAQRAIAVYKDKVIYEIDSEFNKFMGRFGIDVNMKKLGLLSELGEKLTEFEQNLRSKKIKATFVRAILEEVDLTFKAVHEQLGKRAAALVVPEKDKPE